MDYEIKDGRIVNATEEVAVRWNRLTQKYVNVGSHEYIFAIRSDISLAWIKPEDVDRVLAIRSTCCGGSQAVSCHLASELDVKRWLGISVW